MTTTWVDFAAVKAAVTIEMVLDHYGLQLHRVNKTTIRGKCPLPTHSSESSHQSFGVNTQKNVWACQSQTCKAARGGRAGGNVLDFVSLMESCSVRDAALKLQEWFQVDASNERPASGGSPAKRTPKAELAAKKAASPESDNKGDQSPDPAENKPLGFALKGVDSSHVYLAHRGISKETAEYFGVGYFPGKGTMSGRVVIPIHNEKGDLIAYAGRWPGESGWPEGKDKYELPSGFKKTLALYNLHRAVKAGEGRAVILVEGFFGVMKIHQAGFPCVVAQMGDSLSDVQQELLSLHFDQVVLMLDGDDAGRKASADLGARLADAQLDVYVVMLASGEQPDRLSSERIRALLSFLLRR